MNGKLVTMMVLSGAIVGTAVYAAMAQSDGARRFDSPTAPAPVVFNTLTTLPPTDNIEVARVYATAAIAQEFIRSRGNNASISDIAPLISNIRNSLK